MDVLNTQIADLLKLQFVFTCSLENNNLAINEAHTFILAVFNDRRNQRLEQAIQLRDRLVKVTTSTAVDQAAQEQKLTYLNQIISRIYGQEDMREYNNLVTPYIEAYKVITNEMERLRCIENYLNILSNYISVNVIQNNTNIETHTPLAEAKSAKKKDPSKISQENILKAIRRYAGKQPDETPADLYNQLENYFSAYPLPYTRERCKVLPFDSKGRRVGTDRDLMSQALKETGNSKFYEDINLICANYWGWKLADVSAFEAKALANAELTQIVFEKIKTRKSNLNIDFLAWKHLQAVGHNADRDDFKMIKSPEILREYEEQWEKMVAGANEMIEEFNKTVPEHERRAKIPYIPTVR